MAGKKEQERFIFYKYVPPRKGGKPLKDEQYSATPEDGKAEWFGPPVPELPEYPDQPEYPEYPELPEYPQQPEIPGLPEIPECPEFPEMPETPEIPEPPECPELPEEPEVPEVPEVPEGPCPENAMMHVIQAGDTFWKLAKRYGTTVEAIAAANPDLDPLNLQIGESICIPLGIPGAKG